MWMCAHEYRGPRRPGASDTLELNLGMILNHLMWVLGIELGPFGRATDTLKCHITSLPCFFLSVLLLFICLSCFEIKSLVTQAGF